MKRRSTDKVRRFLADNYRTLLFLVLPLAGCLLGVLLYGAVRGSSWATLLPIGSVPRTFGAICSAFWSSCFQPLLLLALLFVAGLSACGSPVALATPVFWGVGLGLTQAYYYAGGWAGVGVTAAVLLPHSVMEAVALLMGAAECFRMSICFATILLPHSAHCGGLWQPFRLYVMRFLLLTLLLFGAAALDVGMRLLCAGWL